MDRYNNLKITKDISGIRRLVTTSLPNIPIYSDDIYLITDYNTRLDLLAAQYYDDTTTWPIIAKANNLGKGTIFTGPGIQLRIPAPNALAEIKKLIDFENLNRY